MHSVIATDASGAAATPTPLLSDVGLLRFFTCGSVDDGKSTLIGRLLLDCRKIYEDQIVRLASDTSRFGTTAPGENTRETWLPRFRRRTLLCCL
jgi:bifunctional enzyme CysN/CysC